jgi:hypothetical protein
VKSPDQTAATQPEDKGKEPSPGELRAKRKELIDQMIQDGYLDHIEPGWPAPYVWVTTNFLVRSYDAQRALLEIIYAYYVTDQRAHDMAVYSSRSGKEVAVYSPLSGLRFE